MVDQVDADQRRRVGHPPRELHVGVAGRGIAAYA